MMRDVTFRGKALADGKWWYGSYIHLDDTTWCFKEDYDAHPENTHHYIIYDKMTDWNLPNDHHMVEVDGKTVGQDTGCVDKNSRHIFEGDIVRKRTHNGVKELPVCFSEGCFHCGFGGGSSTPTHPYTLKDGQIEVVGNIYDGLEDEEQNAHTK